MIVVDDEYRIESDKYGFTLYKQAGVDQKGNPIKRDPAYGGSIGDVLRSYYQKKTYELASGERITIEEYMQKIAELKKSMDVLSEKLDWK